MIDLSQVKAGTMVRLFDKAEGMVVGSYLSDTGLVLRVKTGADSTVTRNVPVALIMEIIEPKKEGE